MMPGAWHKIRRFISYGLLKGTPGTFREEGWVPLEPPMGGGVMFLNRERQQSARRETDLMQETIEP